MNAMYATWASGLVIRVATYGSGQTVLLCKSYAQGTLLKKPLETAFTPSCIRLVTVTRYYNIEQARKVLRYEPVVPLKEGIRRAVEARPGKR
jgi:nucleoside-diphosphate-sugar epimerase